MKKYSLLLIALFIWGCEKQYNTVIDPPQPSYSIRQVSSFPSFTYVPGDSNFIAYVTVDNSNDISSISMDVYSPASKLSPSGVLLYDDGNMALHGDQTAGDNSYANKFSMKQSYPNGKYQVEYFITTKQGTSSKAAVHNFTYNNGQSNIAPLINNLVAPDTIFIGSPASLISVVASDSNGQNDIETVYFISYRPNGTTSGFKFILSDDGIISSTKYDATAGDNIFSNKIAPDTSSLRGTWRFEFQAQDRGKKLSNKIIHNVVLK